MVQRVTTNDSEWQQVTTSDTTSDNEWYNEWQRVTTNDNESQRMAFKAIFFFFFFRIREEPITKHPKEKSLNLEEDLDKGLLNFEQKQAPEKKY